MTGCCSSRQRERAGCWGLYNDCRKDQDEDDTCNNDWSGNKGSETCRRFGLPALIGSFREPAAAGYFPSRSIAGGAEGVRHSGSRVQDRHAVEKKVSCTQMNCPTVISSRGRKTIMHPQGRGSRTVPPSRAFPFPGWYPGNCKDLGGQEQAKAGILPYPRLKIFSLVLAGMPIPSSRQQQPCMTRIPQSG